MHKIGQSGGFLGRLLGPILKTGLSSIGNVLKPLAKSVLKSLASADAAIYNKNAWIRCYNVNNIEEEMNDIIKIVKSLKESGLLIKGVSQTIKNETKE